MGEPPSDDVPDPSLDVVNTEFNTEAIKLLLQAAWANDELDPKEREFVAKLGKAWGVPPATLEALLAHLDEGKPLPQPNLALLRTRPEKVLRAAEALIAVDGGRDEAEREFITELKTLLGCA